MSSKGARVTLPVVCLVLIALVVTAATTDEASRHPSLAFAAPGTPTLQLYLPFVAKSYFPVPIAPLWRFGVAQARRSFLAYNPTDVASLRLGWYVDWGASGASIPMYGIEYVPMVRVKQLKLNGSTPTSSPCAGCPYVTPYTYTVSLSTSQIQSLASGRPGLVWAIGNEIERRDWGNGSGNGQDEIVPQLYAQAYHDL